MTKKPRREALVEEIERLKWEKAQTLDAMERVLEAQKPLRERALDLYRHGCSNAWISKLLKISLSEARRLTWER